MLYFCIDMKKKFFKKLYQIFAFLSDKTNGWKIFVNPKLFFGALIIGVATVSTTSCRTCHAPKSTCYDVDVQVLVPQQVDSIPEIKIEPFPEPSILCYDPIAPPEK